MIKATGFAVARARKLRAVFVAGFIGFVLAACGGGEGAGEEMTTELESPRWMRFRGAEGLGISSEQLQSVARKLA